MEKYIILIDSQHHCVDLCCAFSMANNVWTVEITDPYGNAFFIVQKERRQSYAQAAKYILDQGVVITIAPIDAKNSINYFRSYIRMEQVSRHLAVMRGNL